MTPAAPSLLAPEIPYPGSPLLASEHPTISSPAIWSPFGTTSLPPCVQSSIELVGVQGDLGPLVTPAAPSLLAPDVELGARQRAEYIGRQLQLRGAVRIDALVQVRNMQTCANMCCSGQGWVCS